MIYFIEGCTCAGKSTLAREYWAKNPSAIIAPEHTPKLVDNEEPDARQARILTDYMQHFRELLEITEKTFIADFSPLGVIPFTYALADHYAYSQKGLALYKMARNMQYEWEHFYAEHKNELVCLDFLIVAPETIIARLKARRRNGDEVWKPAFIRFLCLHYFKTKEHYAKELKLC